MCIIPLLSDWNYELIETLSMILARLLYLVHVIALSTSVLLGNEHGIIEFPLQQRLRERAAVLRYTYITCLLHMPLSMYFGRCT
jgi:hypothetical protein